MNEKLRVLAVADPAVLAYTEKGILASFQQPVHCDIFQWDRYYSEMMKVFQGEGSYDIVMVAGHLWKRDFIEKNYLAPISFDAEDILPSVVRELHYNGTCYLSPSFCDGHLVVYRKSIMRAVLGRELADSITPQEYCEVAQKLKTGGYHIAMKAHPSEIFTDALPFLRMNGQDVYHDDGRPNCNRTEVIEGLASYCALRQTATSDTDTYSNAEVAQQLQTKGVAMGITWSGQMGVVYGEDCIEKEDLGFSCLTTSWNVTWSFALAKTSQNKEKAEELLRYLRSPEVDYLAGQGSGAPVRTSSYLKDMDNYPWYSCQLEMLKKAKGLPDIANAGDSNGVFYEEITRAFQGEITPQHAMESAEARILKIIGE